ncbi:3-dehydroquinate synthase, partial [hydrothermal vent metagenome]
KNMIGAFHQPQCVIADTNTLDTLDDCQLSSGIAEVIKYGLINDKPFFLWIEQNIEKLLTRDHEALAYAIECSCRDKAAIVAEDEREGGVRALLNLGHTFGHAIETGMGYGTWLHGEAVAVGMLMAADLSMRMGWISTDDLHRIDNLLDRSGLPTRAPVEMTEQRFLSLMSVDKKVEDGHLRLVLMRSLGESIISSDFSHALLAETINAHHAISA